MIDTTGWMSVTPRPEVLMDRGEGSWLWDSEGRRYLDFVQGWAVNALGHAPPEIRDALARQSTRLLTPSPAFHNEPQLELSRALTAHCALDRVFLASSGAEANEGAIKLARKWGRVHRGGAWEIVTTHGAFHGRTLATMAASGKPGWDALFPPRVPGFRKVPYGDASAVARSIRDETVAVWVEPIQGEAGVVVPPAGYLRDLRELTARHGILLMLDEVQTGMARTGPLFAHLAEDIEPDVMTLGKGLGSGVPLSALLAREEVCCFDPGDQGGTHAGNPLMAAVGLRVLEKLVDPSFAAARAKVAARLRRGLEERARRHRCHGVEGRGFLLALKLPLPRAAEVAAACFDRGALVNAPRPDRIRLMPALTVSAGEVDMLLGILSDALGEVLPKGRGRG